MQIVLDFVRARSEIAGTHHVEGDVHAFGYGLGGEGFAYAGGTGEEHDDPFSFAFDYVVEGVFVRDLAFDEGHEEVFGVVGKDEGVECSVVPFDVFDAVYEE